jgi:O-antigen ligase
MLQKILLFLAFYLPFQVALNLRPGIDLASIRLLILIVFFLWLADSLRRKKIIVSNNPQTILISIFLFLNLLSFFFARNPDWSARKLLFLFSVFPIYFVFSAVIQKKAQATKVFKALVISGSLAAVIGIAQFFGQFFWGLENLYAFWGRFVAPVFLGHTFSETVLSYPSWLVNISGATYFRAISFFPDPHMFSLFLGMILPISVGLFFLERKRIWLLSTAFIFLANLLTFSRGAYLGLAAGFLFLAVFFWRKMKKNHKVPAVILSALLFLILLVPNPVSVRFFSSFNLKEGSNIGRMEMWQAAFSTISQKPWLGAGIGNFPLEIDPLTTYREPIYAHNTYLDIATEAGILAALSWIGIVFFSLLACLKKSEGDILWLGAGTGLVIFAAHSLVETGLYSPTVLSLFLIIVALSNKSKKNEELE